MSHRKKGSTEFVLLIGDVRIKLVSKFNSMAKETKDVIKDI